MADRGDELGFDLSIGPVAGGGVDMSRNARSCSGVELVRNGMVARSMSGTIPLIGAPGGRVDFGEDVRAWVGEALTDGAAATKAQRLAIVYARDRRLDPGRITVKVTPQPAGAQYAFLIAVQAFTVTGAAVPLLLGINDLSVDVLAQQGSS